MLYHGLQRQLSLSRIEKDDTTFHLRLWTIVTAPSRTQGLVMACSRGVSGMCYDVSEFTYQSCVRDSGAFGVNVEREDLTPHEISQRLRDA